MKFCVWILFMGISSTVLAAPSLNKYSNGEGWDSFFRTIKVVRKDAKSNRIPVEAIAIAACIKLAQAGNYSRPTGVPEQDECLPFATPFMTKNGLKAGTFRTDREVKAMLQRGPSIPTGEDVDLYWRSLVIPQAEVALVTNTEKETESQRLQEEINELRNGLGNKVDDEKVVSLSNRLDLLKQSLDEGLRKRGSEQAGLVKQVASLSTEIIQLRESVTGIEVEVAGQGDSFASIEGKMDGHLTELINLRNADTAQASRIDGLESRLDTEIKGWVWPLVSGLGVVMVMLVAVLFVQRKQKKTLSKFERDMDGHTSPFGNGEIIVEGLKNRSTTNALLIDEQSALLQKLNKKIDGLAVEVKGVKEHQVAPTTANQSEPYITGSKEMSGVYVDDIHPDVINGLTIGNFIEVMVKPIDPNDCRSWQLKVRRTGISELTIEGVIRQIGHDAPLVIHSLNGVENAIHRAAKSGRLVGQLQVVKAA